MKRAVKISHMLVVAFVLVSQVSALALTAQAALQGNKRTYMKKIPPPAQPINNNSGTGQNYRCIRRCRRAYNQCLFWAGNNRGRRRVCAVRYRNCVKRCDY